MLLVAMSICVTSRGKHTDTNTAESEGEERRSTSGSKKEKRMSYGEKSEERREVGPKKHLLSL